ncbi:MAG: alkaline phosphatase D family protein [Actinomycetota bacterium]
MAGEGAGHPVGGDDEHPEPGSVREPESQPDRRRRRLLGAGSAAAVAAAFGLRVDGRALWRSCATAGQQPGSSAPPLPDGPIRWIWTGATTSTSADVRLRPTDGSAAARLALSASAELTHPHWVDGTRADGSPVVRCTATGLEPDTTYHYAPEVDGVLDRGAGGSFRTFPEGPSSFLVAFGGCAQTGSNRAVFDAIADLEPTLFGVIGDFHYADVDTDDVARFHDALDRVLRSPAQSALYRSTSVAYVWDDHDYGTDNADRTAPSRPAAMAAYRQYVPSYELAGPTTSIHQAFTIGRVRFVMTDARSERDPSGLPDDADKSMLGPDQKAWLKAELVRASSTHALVVWIQPVPWTGVAEVGGDSWGGYSTERRELADFLVDEGITNLVMVSGDAHMVAIDDGTNTNLSDRGRLDTPTGGFPLLHVAALDQVGSRKGGPYSHGEFPGGARFGTVEVIDDGSTIDVVLAGRDWRGTPFVEHRVTVR